MTMDRRDLLAAVVALIACMPPGPGLAAMPLRRDGHGLAEVLAALLPHAADSARRIGQAYLADLPPGTNLMDLAEVLRPAAGGADIAELRARIAAACREDFANGRTVMLDGWVLSRSEVHVCALMALLAA